MRDSREILPDPLIRLVFDARAAHVGHMDDMLSRLCAIVGRHAACRYQPSALPRVALYKDGAAPQPVSGVYQPMMALIVSGAKEIAIGDRRLRYNPASYFIATVELPASGCVKLDLPDERYLAVSLDLDSDRLASVLTEVEARPIAPSQPLPSTRSPPICSTPGSGSFAFSTQHTISPRWRRSTNARSCTGWYKVRRARSCARSHARTAASRKYGERLR